MSTHPDSSNPAFQTPQPTELQSKENREAVLQRVTEQQGAETDVTDDTESGASTPVDPAQLENLNRTENRHLPLIDSLIDSPPG
ncbi:MAG: hypothetical protein ACKO7W_11945 [Elainella sp.]